MDKLLKVEDVAEVLQVTRATAYKYIRQMRHMENPVRVTEGDFRAWMQMQMAMPGEIRKEPKKKKQGKMHMPKVGPGPDGKWHVPRIRPS